MDAQDMIPEWMLTDNRQRSEGYARNLDDENFIHFLNDILAPHEQDLQVPEREPYPIIFFFGLPRIGKTMFSQLLCHSLKLGFPDNLVARFWRAPVFGIRLSVVLNKSQIRTQFKSDIGKTHFLSEPHDFAYFWHHWLQIDPTKPYDPAEKRAYISWHGLTNELKRMSHAWGSAAVFKGVLPSYQLNQIAQAYQKSFFIYIQRDYIDCALSFCQAKRNTFGDPNAWFGQLPGPEDYDRLDGLAYPEKIAGHFAALVKLYQRQLGELDPGRWMKVRYDQVCKQPRSVIREIIDRVGAGFNHQIETRFDPPESFTPSIHSEDEADYAVLAAALNEVGLPLRF
jgi:hypothetical protein